MKFKKLLFIGIGKSALEDSYWEKIDRLTEKKVFIDKESAEITKELSNTDGVHDNLTFKEMEEVVTKNGDVAKLLVEKAKKRSKENHFRSKPDDISAIVIEVN